MEKAVSNILILNLEIGRRIMRVNLKMDRNGVLEYKEMMIAYIEVIFLKVAEQEKVDFKIGMVIFLMAYSKKVFSLDNHTKVLGMPLSLQMLTIIKKYIVSLKISVNLHKIFPN
jgi:hypothetical protein